MTFLLNPKNLLIIGLVVAFAVLGGLWQWERIHAGKLQNQVDGLQGHVDSLMTQIATRDSIIEDQKKNLAEVMASYEEMRKIKQTTKVIRKTIVKLKDSPTGKACETSDQLGADYAAVANSITAYIRTGVRGKIKAARDDHSKTAIEDVPRAGSAGVH